MCTYLYAAFSLRDGESEGLQPAEAAAVIRWRRVLLEVAVEEMGHLVAVWNITAAIGGTPRLGRANFPLDPGYLPASVVVKLAPFNTHTLQHFIYLERPHGSDERDGEGFAAERLYVRGDGRRHLTPMGINYETVGDFYAALSHGLRDLAGRYGEDVLFSGDPRLQLSPDEVALGGAQRVICLKTALAAFEAIVAQGEGAPRDLAGSHFQKFCGIREELQRLRRENPSFTPAFPAATNPVLRRPPRPEGRVWLENTEAIDVVDLANASYGLMLRLLGYSYLLPGPSAEKGLAVDLSIGLMHAAGLLGQRAARLPAGPANPECNAGMSFTSLRDASPLPPGQASRRLFVERLAALAEAGEDLRSTEDPRVRSAADQLAALSRRAKRGFEAARGPAPSALAAAPAASAPASQPPGAGQGGAEADDGVERVRGGRLELAFNGKRCIHARFCVTGAPMVFLSNVQGPWIHPDAMAVEQVVEVAHACPSGAIQYRRVDGGPDEPAPPVNLAAIREAGPYAFRGRLEIDGEPCGFRATLCRCGASKNKPFCDGSHHEAGFAATGEPASGSTGMLPVRDGVVAIDPVLNGPLSVRGNLEIVSGTGRVVARLTSARLCRCGGSASKPFCDGTHARIGFVSGP